MPVRRTDASEKIRPGYPRMRLTIKAEGMIIMSRRRVSRKKGKKAPPGGKGLFSKKVSMFFYVIVLILAVGARTNQLFYNMDFTTGRYIDPDITKNYTFMAVAGGLAFLLLVLLVGSSRDKVVDSAILINPMRLRYDRLNKKIPASAGYSAVLMGILIGAQIYFDFWNIIRENEDIMQWMPPEDAANYSKLTGYTPGMGVTHFIMLIVVLTFFSIASNIFKGEGLSNWNCASLAFYSIWQTIQVYSMVFSETSMSLSSETVYILLSRMTAAVFFLLTARLFNGMEKKSTRILMCFTGYAASILAAVSVIPRYVMLLIPVGFDERLDMAIPDAADVGIIFMTITIVVVFWSSYSYRDMPRLSTGKQRWTRAPMSKKYLEMEALDEEGYEDDSTEDIL